MRSESGVYQKLRSFGSVGSESLEGVAGERKPWICISSRLAHPDAQTPRPMATPPARQGWLTQHRAYSLDYGRLRLGRRVEARGKRRPVELLHGHGSPRFADKSCAAPAKSKVQLVLPSPLPVKGPPFSCRFRDIYLEP